MSPPAPSESRSFTKAARKRQVARVNDTRKAPLLTSTDLSAAARRDVGGALNGLLADVFALYLKTKNFHWHMRSPRLRACPVMLDEQAEQLYAMIDPIAERIRALGGTTLRSIGHIARMQRIADNDAEFVEPPDMLAELRQDSAVLTARLRNVHGTCEEHNDVTTARFIEVWIDETEQRAWSLFEAGRAVESSGH